MGTRIVVTLLTVLVGILQAVPNARAQKETDMNTVRVRYMVNDVDSAVSFYTKYLGFQVKQGPTPNFAILSRGSLELMLPNGSRS
jgi:catechol-2,3-dioxygenase